MTDILKIAFIRARWHARIVDEARAGFEARLDETGSGAEISTYAVPGAFEMPLLAKKLGQRGAQDAIVCAACVVDGRIYRHEFVAQAVVDGPQPPYVPDHGPVTCCRLRCGTVPSLEHAPRSPT